MASGGSDFRDCGGARVLGIGSYVGRGIQPRDLVTACVLVAVGCVACRRARHGEPRHLRRGLSHPVVAHQALRVWRMLPASCECAYIARNAARNLTCPMPCAPRGISAKRQAYVLNLQGQRWKRICRPLALGSCDGGCGCLLALQSEVEPQSPISFTMI